MMKLLEGIISYMMKLLKAQIYLSFLAQIAPADLEALLLGHPDIVDVAVTS
jgi:hypothetical protein